MKKREIVILLMGILPIVVLVFVGYKYPFSLFANPERFRNYILGYGVLAPIVFVIINTLQVIITPISWPVVSQAGGFIFGFWFGSFLNWFGRAIGSIIAYYIARWLGEKVVRRFIHDKTYKELQKIINKGAIFVFLVFALPSILDDELAWVSGLMGMKSATFIIIALIGSISGSVVNAFVGSSIAENNFIPFAINIGLTIIGIVYLSKVKLDRLNSWFEKRFTRLK